MREAHLSPARHVRMSLSSPWVGGEAPPSSQSALGPATGLVTILCPGLCLGTVLGLQEDGSTKIL